MTDELKHKFEQLVADAPPPTGVPSEGVFERVRIVKRRRRATAGILATAAVVAAAIAAGNLTGLNSAPAPATNTPGPTPIVTGPPTIKPSSPITRTTIAGSVNTLPPVQNSADKPSGDPSSPTTQSSSPDKTGLAAPPGPYQLNFSFTTSTDGLTGRINITATGSVLAPVFEEGGSVTSSKFHDNLLYSEYWWGDGTHVEEDKYGGMFCPQPDQPATMKKVTGQGVRPMTHKYAKAGSYQFAYRVTYCTPSGPVKFARAWDITVFDPASPKP
ncbi:hypothetical protein [Kribbella monticola]|uniref:hypothetical protein n=1 Tax=Kribbella monticola TaxID=2185285 RepID=UPI000DD30FB4|nr:hypothetical protein [Kribbella monticola]